MGVEINFSKLDEMQVTPLDDLSREIRSGDLIFCSGNYPFSGLIRLATDSLWSHVGMILRVDELGGHFVIESIETIGVRLVPLSRFLNDYRDSLPYSGRCLVARVNLPPAFAAADALQFAAPLLGTSYDGWENARIVWRMLSHQRRLIQNDRYNCAELATALMEAGGYSPKLDKRLANTPEGIWRGCVVDILGRIR